MSVSPSPQAPGRIFLIDLPTYPKGTVALSLYAVAASLQGWDVVVIDLNMEEFEVGHQRVGNPAPLLIGLKVSAQNHLHAIETTIMVRELYPSVPVLWGGELPTLLPDECLLHCDSVVIGAIEPIADQLMAGLLAGKLAQRYDGRHLDTLLPLLPARLDLLPHPDHYPRFMGLPMESSRGCTYKCTFCMVHTMQPRYLLKSEEQLRAELPMYAGQFLNLVDYNFGLDAGHVRRVAAAIRDSEVLGWMGEMCLESLDNDDLLRALAESRCRTIYCGLEAIEEMALRSINKAKTNHIDHYDRIIAKVQSHGIQIAAGMIVGLEGTTREGMVRMREYYQERGLLYAKLTFLTYNPGTKVKQSMERRGNYLTQDIERFDGQHLTFLPHGVDPQEVVAGLEDFIRRFYDLREIVRRSQLSGLSRMGRKEFVLFNLCYREVYLEWLRSGIFHDEAAFRRLLEARFTPSAALLHADRRLHEIRQWRYEHEKP